MAQNQPLPAVAERILLFVAPMFPSQSLTALSNVFRLANRESGQSVIEWRLASPNGGAVTASDGLQVDTVAYTQLAATERFLLVLASYRPLDLVDKALLRWLRRQHRRGCFVGGIESGTYLLAAAGILGEHAVALHHEDMGTFHETWPNQSLFHGLYNIDARIASAAGGASTIDFALAFVERLRGPLLAEQIARICLHPRRDPLGRMAAARATASVETNLLERCRALMLEHLEDPLPIGVLCARLGINERRLRRLFGRALGVSPARYYLALRLTEARFMLVSTDLAVGQVGLACGFDNPAVFSRAFRAHFGFAPSTRRTPYTGLLPTPFWP